MVTFSLIVALLYPQGDLQIFDMGPGLTREERERAAAYARVQLPATLVEAVVFSIDCMPDREV